MRRHPSAPSELSSYRVLLPSYMNLQLQAFFPLPHRPFPIVGEPPRYLDPVRLPGSKLRPLPSPDRSYKALCLDPRGSAPRVSLARDLSQSWTTTHCLRLRSCWSLCGTRKLRQT